MAELWAAFHGAWKGLAFGALGALLAVLAEDGAAAGPTSMALLAVLAESGTAALPASLAVLAVRALLPNLPPDWCGAGGGSAGTAAAASMAQSGSDMCCKYGWCF